MPRLCVTFVSLLLIFTPIRAFADGYKYTLLDYPGEQQTIIHGIVGDDVYGSAVGRNKDGSLNFHNFIFNLPTRQFLKIGKIDFTRITGCSGDIFVGFYYTPKGVHSFIYNHKIQTYTHFDSLLANRLGKQNIQSTLITGISGNTVFGVYGGIDKMNHGFIYDLDRPKAITFDEPSAGYADLFVNGTCIVAISNGAIIGWYGDAKVVTHGFIYDRTKQKFTTFDAPGVINNKYQGTMISSISGPNICGWYSQKLALAAAWNKIQLKYLNPLWWGFNPISDQIVCGFIYNLQNQRFISINPPLEMDTSDVTQISGNLAIGNWVDSNDITYGFVYNLSSGEQIPLNDPSAQDASFGRGTRPEGIIGSTIVGNYTDKQRIPHGFIATPN